MNLIDKLLGYISTPDNRGVGVQNLAFVSKTPNGVADSYSPYRMVRRSMNATRAADVKFAQGVPIVPIEGNGSYIQGVFAMQALLDLDKQQKGAAK